MCKIQLGGADIPETVFHAPSGRRFSDKVFDLEAVRAVITKSVKKLVETAVVNLEWFRGL